MHIRGIVFDWGNTIVDYPLENESRQIAFLKAWLCKIAAVLPVDIAQRCLGLSRERDALRGFNQECVGCQVRPFGQRIEAYLGVAADSEVALTLEKDLCDTIFSKATIIPHAYRTVDLLQQRGYRLAIASNLPWGTAGSLWKAEINRFHCGRLFQGRVVCCSDVLHRKPHPGIFGMALGLLDLKPEEVLMIGDSVSSDVNGALALGMHALLFDRNPRGLPQYERIRCLSQIPNWLESFNG